MAVTVKSRLPLPKHAMLQPISAEIKQRLSGAATTPLTPDEKNEKGSRDSRQFDDVQHASGCPLSLPYPHTKQLHLQQQSATTVGSSPPSNQQLEQQVRKWSGNWDDASPLKIQNSLAGGSTRKISPQKSKNHLGSTAIMSKTMMSQDNAGIGGSVSGCGSAPPSKVQKNTQQEQIRDHGEEEQPQKLQSSGKQKKKISMNQYQSSTTFASSTMLLQSSSAKQSLEEFKLGKCER